METIPVTGAPLRRQVIFDTDPSPDDAVAFLAALASPEELEVLLLSVTYGNVEVQRYIFGTPIHTLLTSAELFAERGSSISCH